MSTVAGVFSETLLQNTVARADELMLDDRIKQQFVAQVEAAKAFLAAQTANLRVLENPNKDIVLQVWWDNFCGLTTRACTPCDAGGTESSTNIKTYEIDQCRQVVFTIDETNFLTNEADYETHIAKAKLKAKKELAEYITQYMIAILNANAGVNVQDGFQGNVVGTATYIQAPYWTPELYAYFNQISARNQFTNPIFLTGQLMYQASQIAMMNQGNDNGKGQAAMIGALKPYFDLFNIDTVNTPDLVAYLISQGATAFASKAIYPMNNPKDISYDFKGWSEDNPFITGLKENWKYKAECYLNRTVHKFAVDVNFGAFVNPTGCEENNTGILQFICGTGS